MNNDNSELSNLNKVNEDIFRQLVEQTEVRKLPEHLFVRNFLPFFLGEKNPNENPDFYSYWIGITGSPSAELDVIDKSGNILFRVPGLIYSGIINPSRATNNSIKYSDVVMMAKLYGNITPTAGKNALDKGLSEKYRELQSRSPTFQTNVNRWVEIFRRYGKVEQQSEAVNRPVVKDTISDDELEY